MCKLIVASLAIIDKLLHCLFSLFAREEGIEPSLTVLETAFLPLKDSRKKPPQAPPDEGMSRLGRGLVEVVLLGVLPLLII